MHHEIRNVLSRSSPGTEPGIFKLLIHVIRINTSFGVWKVRQPLYCCGEAMVPTLCGEACCRSLGLHGSLYSKSCEVVSGLWEDAGVR